MSELKSQKAKTMSSQGNTQKWRAYAEAFRRIDDSIAAGFHLEAVAIVESILYDRISSYLVKQGKIDNMVYRTFPSGDEWIYSFSQLIKLWREHEAVAQITVGGTVYDNLIEVVDRWRRERNTSIHAMVRSEPGAAPRDINDTLSSNKQCALDGKRLARAVDRYVQRYGSAR